MKRAAIIFLIVASLIVAAFAGFIHGRRLAVKGEPLTVGAWRPFAALPSPRVEPAVTVVGPDVYFFGGFFNLALQATRSVEVFDTESGEWSRLADMPVKVTHLYAVRIEELGELWFAGGFDGDHPGTVTERVLIYDLADDSWSEGPSLPQPRAAGGFARLGSRLHYVGGLRTRLAAAGDHWVLDLDGDRIWRPLASLPAPRSQMPMLAVNGELFVVGGQFGHDQIVRMDRSEIHAYDPETDTWRECASLPRRVSHMEYSSIVLDGKIVVFGGRSLYPRKWYERPTLESDAAVSYVQAYDPEIDEWSSLPSLPVGMLGGVAVRVGERVLVGGGSTYLTGNPHLTIYEGSPF